MVLSDGIKTITVFTDQSPYSICFEQGPAGLAALRPGVDAVVIVDVLSFTTCVDVALARRAFVVPCASREEAAALTQTRGAILAGARDTGGYSLSPSSLLALPEGTRLILTSPNGAVLSLAARDIPCFAGCFRNAESVARAASSVGPRVAVIAAGERWPDGSLRPAVEDMLGAGAVIHHLLGPKSPEAELAESAFLRFRDRLADTLHDCSSGRYLVERGYARDVDIAAAYNVSATAPRLLSGAFVSTDD
ncbi:MAG TPA: 2-phosphosulfolactate phosphatase [Armatimonadota bacterium]